MKPGGAFGLKSFQSLEVVVVLGLPRQRAGERAFATASGPNLHSSLHS